MRRLREEIQIDFLRSMNRITFDRIVKSKSDMFHYVTIQEKEEEVAPERGISPFILTFCIFC